MAAQDEWMKAVRERMDQHGFSERELASLAGMHRSTFRRALAGQAEIRFNDLHSVMAAMGYDIAIPPVRSLVL